MLFTNYVHTLFTDDGDGERCPGVVMMMVMSIEDDNDDDDVQ